MPHVKSGPHNKARDVVATRLEILRKERGLTQEKLSAMAKLHRTYIGRLENKKTGVGIDTLGKICDALGVSLKEFFGG